MLTEDNKKDIIKMLKQNKKKVDIAKELGIKASTVQHCARNFKHISEAKDDSKYFNVELYFKTVATI
jgi:predicted transcriptional regulator